jgi:Ca2+-binding RTX toxin-like protein
MGHVHQRQKITIARSGGGNDVIDAERGHVAIHVGTGNDLLNVGPGHDKIFFDAALAGQVEKIVNFNPSLDKIVLSESDFAGLGPLGTLGPGHFRVGVGPLGSIRLIDYNPSNGFLYFDAQPHIPGPGIHFATLTTHVLIDNHFLTTHPLINNTDFLVEA